MTLGDLFLKSYNIYYCKIFNEIKEIKQITDGKLGTIVLFCTFLSSKYLGTTGTSDAR